MPMSLVDYSDSDEDISVVDPVFPVPRKGQKFMFRRLGDENAEFLDVFIDGPPVLFLRRMTTAQWLGFLQSCIKNGASARSVMETELGVDKMRSCHRRSTSKVRMTVGGPTVTLSNGVVMPLVGLGTWQSSTKEVKTAVHAAIDAGYRLIDTAACYQNEGAIGEAIKEAIRAGKVKREELFITTKLWATHLHPRDTEGALRESLKLLQLDYVDLYLAHMPAAFNNDMSEQDHTCTVEDVWHGLEGVYEKKLTRAIGVSNWNEEQIERVAAKAKVPIHNCQVELYLYWPQHGLQEVCKKHNISLTSYASLGSPGRVNFALPNGVKLDWAPAPPALEDEHVLALAKVHGKTPAQILLRYVLDRGIAIIPKSVTPSRIIENFALFDFTLSGDEIKKLETAQHRQRLFLQDFMVGHPEDPFKQERQ